MKDNTGVALATAGALLLICLFNVYMNLYNDDRIRKIEEKVYSVVDTAIVPEVHHKDTIIVLHTFDSPSVNAQKPVQKKK